MADDPEDSQNFIAICGKCGKVNAVCSDDPSYRKEAAKFVASIVREGRTLEKMTTGEVRKKKNWCHCHRTQPKQTEMF